MFEKPEKKTSEFEKTWHERGGKMEEWKESEKKEGIDAIKEKITEGLDELEKEAKEGKIGGRRINSILGLLREDGPLADDPDREELLNRVKALEEKE